MVRSLSVRPRRPMHEIDGAFPSRGILHDDRLFPDPFTFKPERFIGPDVDPRVHPAVDYAFGFGRRVCPGRWMAHAFVWVVVASVLSAFRIEKAVRDGRVIEPTGAFTPGILA
jgi:cytochrome P450